MSDGLAIILLTMLVVVCCFMSRRAIKQLQRELRRLEDLLQRRG